MNEEMYALEYSNSQKCFNVDQLDYILKLKSVL